MTDYVLKTYRVVDSENKKHDIVCRWMFNNDGDLVFRIGEKGATEVVASFARGKWNSCIKQKDPADG